jgi:hypothetical protein
MKLTLPLMMPLPRDSRADAEPEVGFDTSLMPSGPRGIDNLPPIVNNRVRKSRVPYDQSGTLGAVAVLRKSVTQPYKRR